jgi:Leucine-rich repeat (LRR) protein
MGLPLAFRSYTRDLKVLNLMNNRLKSIDNDILNALSSLTHLDISYNLFADFPYKEDQLENLQFLSIKSNPIDRLPNFLKKSKLEILQFDWYFDHTKIVGSDDIEAQEYIDSHDFEMNYHKIQQLFDR